MRFTLRHYLNTKLVGVWKKPTCLPMYVLELAKLILAHNVCIIHDDSNLIQLIWILQLTDPHTRQKRFGADHAQPEMARF